MKWYTCIVVCLGLVLSARAYSFFGNDDESSDDMMMMADEGEKSMLKQNFHGDCEKILNELAQEYLKATYFYMGMGIALQNPEVNHVGFALMCSTVAKRKLQLGKAVMYYIHRRGGDVTAVDIKAPQPNDWQNPLKVLRQAIGRERQIGAKLLSTFKMADRHHDPYTHHFLEEEIMKEQAEPLAEFVKYLHRIKLAGPQLGVLSSNVEMIMKYKPLIKQCLNLANLNVKH